VGLLDIGHPVTKVVAARALDLVECRRLRIKSLQRPDIHRPFERRAAPDLYLCHQVGSLPGRSSPNHEDLRIGQGTSIEVRSALGTEGLPSHGTAVGGANVDLRLSCGNSE